MFVAQASLNFNTKGENMNEEKQTQRKNFRGTRVYRRRQDGEQHGGEEQEGRQGRVC